MSRLVTRWRRWDLHQAMSVPIFLVLIEICTLTNTYALVDSVFARPLSASLSFLRTNSDAIAAAALGSATPSTTTELQTNFILEMEKWEIYNAAFMCGGSTVKTEFTMNPKAEDDEEMALDAPVGSATLLVSTLTLQHAIESTSNDISVETRMSSVFDWWLDNGDSRSNVTIGHLLSFTSGLSTDATPCSPSTNLEALACARNWYHEGFLYAPGTVFVFKAASLQLAALAVSSVTGYDWSDLVESAFASSAPGVAEAIQYTLPTPQAPGLLSGATLSMRTLASVLGSVVDGNIISSETLHAMGSDVAGSATSVTMKNGGWNPALTYVKEAWGFGLGVWVVCKAAPYAPISECSGGSSNDSLLMAPSLFVPPPKTATEETFLLLPWIDRASKTWGIIGIPPKSTTGGWSKALIIGLAVTVGTLIFSGVYFAYRSNRPKYERSGKKPFKWNSGNRGMRAYQMHSHGDDSL